MLSEPVIRPKVRFVRGGSRAPGARLSVTLAKPPELPSLLKRKLRVWLPAHLARHGKVRFRATAHSGVPAKLQPKNQLKASVKGRVITLEYSPEDFYDYDSDSTIRPPNTAVTFKVTVKRGSLKAVPRKLRRSKFQFRLDGTNVGERWYGDAKKSVVAKAKPVRSHS